MLLKDLLMEYVFNCQCRRLSEKTMDFADCPINEAGLEEMSSIWRSLDNEALFTSKGTIMYLERELDLEHRQAIEHFLDTHELFYEFKVGEMSGEDITEIRTFQYYVPKL